MTTTSMMTDWEPGMDMPYTMPIGEDKSLAIILPAKWLKPDRGGGPLLLPPAVRYLDRLKAIFTQQADWTPGRIAAFREAIGLTQERLGLMLGVSKMTVSRWECGRMKPSEQSLKKMKQMQRQSQRKGAVVGGDK